MIDAGVLQTLIVGHLWQSVVLAAVLACVLILGRKMRGSTRYSLAGAAFAASLVLPLSAFIPGETLAVTLMEKLGVGAISAAPQKAEQAAPAAMPAPTLLQTFAAQNDVPDWIANIAPQAVATAIPAGVRPSETDWGKAAVEGGAPKWAIDLGGGILRSATVSAPAQPAAAPTPPPAKPLFTFPEFKLPALSLPTLNVPDLTLPLIMVWIAGALILLVRTGRDLIAVERLVARARPADLPEILRPRMQGVRVAVSTEAPGPMAAGLFRPCVVLPESIALGSPGMAALLEHERAHIRRGDMAIALAQRVVLALLWWSPALYWISRRIDEEREVACDEAAVERTGDPKAFARSLTSQAENQLWARAPRLAVGAIGPRSLFGRRIRRLIDLAKSGGSPAKYSGRLAFAGLALAVATAAMLTPRFTATAQPSPPPADQALAGGPIDLTRDAREQADQARDRARDQVREAKRSKRGDNDLDGGNNDDSQDFAALGDDIGKLAESLRTELKGAFAGLSPDLDGELQGLSAEMAALGVEISASASQQVLAQMPEIMAQVRSALAEQGIDIDDVDGFSDVDQEKLRDALQEARDQIRDQVGPELRDEIRQAIEDARKEIAEHRDEIAAATEQSRDSMQIAREAMAKARAEIDAARARGDFDKYKNYDWKNGKYDWKGGKYQFNFDIDKDVIAKLKEKGIDIHNPAIRTSVAPEDRLYRAAQSCNVKETARLIVDEKADVNRETPGNGTPLFAAAQAGCMETVRALLNAGADPNKTAPGRGGPLVYAVMAGNKDMVGALLRAGAKPDRAAPGGRPPIVSAVQAGKEDIVRLLLDAGANPDARGPGGAPPLVQAVQAGRIDIVKLLVGKGANVNAFSHTGGAPLAIAERSGRKDIADYLRSKGAVEKAPS